MQKYLFLILICFNYNIVNAQNEADTTNNSKCDSLASLQWVADSAFMSFKTEKFKTMRVFFPSYKEFKTFTDTSQAGKQSEYTRFLMYNSYWNTLRIQFAKTMKKCNKAGIKWDKTTLDSTFLEKGKDKGLEFAYIYWIIKYNNKKRYLLKATSLKINGSWYILDELQYIGILKLPKKPKKKAKRPLRSYN